MNRIILAIVLLPMLAAGTGCATFSMHKGDEAASAKVTEAQKLLRESKYAHAIAEFRKVIQEHPNTEWAAKAKYGIAMAYVSASNPQKDYAVAVAEFDEFLAQYPQDERIPEARSWRQALKVLLDTKKDNDRLNQNIEKLKQLDVRQEEKRLGR
ncbi:MAG: outer membrane protein assembly factor BamD [Nitrospirae bacterium]|nr:outer membrane protein assembly factor BamD [Nitrospirota bacterium]